MFTDIEKEYQKGLSEKRFWSFYLWAALPIIFGLAMLTVVFNLNSWLLAIVAMIYLFWLVGYFFRKDMRRVIGERHPKKRKFREKLRAYAEADNVLRMNILLESLRKYNINNREDLRLAIEFYEGRRPVTTKTGLLEWVLSVAITLASVVAFAYDDNTNGINNAKLLAVLWPTLQIVLCIAVPLLVIGILANKVFFSRAKIDSILIEDLSYIYTNFDKFEKKLK